MGADALVYCLEQLTDYDQFERLCHDLMALEGYRNIEPLGGSKDKGRDAIHVDRENHAETTVFAYSVREDWRKKLEEDAAKIPKHGHPCARFVFLCTAHYSANERDEAVAFIRREYGWKFELYGLERLRVLLATTHREVVAKHPQIFCPPFFLVAGGLSLAPCFDQVLIDDADTESPLALWIARRLTLAGYRVWCRHLAPLAGSSAAETIKALIRARAFRYLPILSPAAVESPDLTSRRSFAHAIGEERHAELVLPLYAAEVDSERLDHETRRLIGAHFETGWAGGLKQLLAALNAALCPKCDDGASSSVLHSLMPPDVLVDSEELLAANVFPVKTVPALLRCFKCDEPLTHDRILESRTAWAFRMVSPNRFISFCPPPAELQERFSLTPACTLEWRDHKEMDSIATYDLTKELLRRSIDVACASKGLVYCADRQLFYFPSGVTEHNMLSVNPVHGKRRRVGVVGERTFGVGQRKAKYRYYVAPTFFCSWRSGRYEIVVRLRLRISNMQGALYPARAALARRKDIGGTWWNDDWLNRVMAVMQFLATDDVIRVGSTSEDAVEVSSIPQTWRVPIGINEFALLDAKENRDEVTQRGHDDGEKTDDDDDDER
jgi:hypothetical protein